MTPFLLDNLARWTGPFGPTGLRLMLTGLALTLVGLWLVRTETRRSRSSTIAWCLAGIYAIPTLYMACSALLALLWMYL